MSDDNVQLALFEDEPVPTACCPPDTDKPDADKPDSGAKTPSRKAADKKAEQKATKKPYSPPKPLESTEPPKGIPRIIRVYGSTIVLDKGESLNWTLEQVRQYLETEMGMPEFTKDRTTMSYYPPVTEKGKDAAGDDDKKPDEDIDDDLKLILELHPDFIGGSVESTGTAITDGSEIADAKETGAVEETEKVADADEGTKEDVPASAVPETKGSEPDTEADAIKKYGFIVPTVSARKGGIGFADTDQPEARLDRFGQKCIGGNTYFVNRDALREASPGQFALLASNGKVYVRQTLVGMFSRIVDPHPIVAKFDGLKEWQPGMEFLLPKMPTIILDAAIEICQYVFEQCGCEAGVVVYFDLNAGSYILDVPDQLVEPYCFIFDQEYLIANAAKTSLVEVMQIHSHTHPSINYFSSVDDSNERSPQVYGLVVLGGETPITHFRANCLGCFFPVDPDAIFGDATGLPPSKLVLPEDIVLKEDGDGKVEGDGSRRSCGRQLSSKQQL